MTVQPNGTDAKDIVFHFLKLTDTRATAAIMGRYTNQIKNILKAGYTKQEILDVMDYIITEKGVRVYSIGYFSACINDALRELKDKQTQEALKAQQEKLQEEIQEVYAKQRSEVNSNEESSRRNRDKASRFGVQSRKRAQLDFDLFER